MAWTQSDLDNIESAIASGLKKVRLGQREREYQSVEQMEISRDLIRQSINKSTSTIPRPKSFLSRTYKGL